jgi:hypothetical protein
VHVTARRLWTRKHAKRALTSTDRVGVVLLGALALGGCAERRLVAAPETTPSTVTWVAVCVAGVLVAALAGVLATLPVWRARGGRRLAAVVLAAQVGVVLVGGAVLTGVAVRSGQLIDTPVDEQAAGSLVRLSRVDGDAAFFVLMAVALVVLTIVVGTVLALAARFAASDQPLERWLACCLLAVEVGLCGFAAIRLGLGDRGWPYLGPALALPILAAALATCWPRPQQS